MSTGQLVWAESAGGPPTAPQPPGPEGNALTPHAAHSQEPWLLSESADSVYVLLIYFSSAFINSFSYLVKSNHFSIVQNTNANLSEHSRR